MPPDVSRRRVSQRLAGMASGAALFGLAPSLAVAQASPSAAQALREGLAGLDGALLLDDAARQAMAVDYGRIVRRLPLAVLRPASVDDVVRLVQVANQRGLKVAMRGNGNAMLGQAQVEDGVVIDSSTLNAVRVVDFRGQPAIEAGPGALWGAVYDAAYARRLRVPVTVPSFLSVGGTLSTGGFHASTWREGFQVDHVLELQVVTGEGQLVTCSDDHNRVLFDAMLGGMGQCGLIVKAVVALVPAPTHVLSFVLGYPDWPTALHDLMRLAQDGRFDEIDGNTRERPGGGLAFNLACSVFHDAPATPSEPPLLAGLAFTSKQASLTSYPEYARRIRFSPPTVPQPWLHVCLPASAAEGYGARVLGTPEEVAYSTQLFSVWRTSRIRRPLCRVPTEDFAVRFQLQRRPPASVADMGALLAVNRRLYERARDLGGTRLTTTAVPFSRADWVRYYGPAWGPFQAAKDRFDPNRVLTPGQGMFEG
jgi:FAD/FMN-containing dehydrogenase